MPLGFRRHRTPLACRRRSWAAAEVQWQRSVLGAKRRGRPGPLDDNGNGRISRAGAATGRLRGVVEVGGRAGGCGNSGRDRERRSARKHEPGVGRGAGASVRFHEFGETVLGEQVVQRLAEQRLNGGVSCGEAAQLSADFGTEVPGDAHLADAAVLAAGGSGRSRRLGIATRVIGGSGRCVGLLENRLAQVGRLSHGAVPVP